MSLIKEGFNVNGVVVARVLDMYESMINGVITKTLVFSDKDGRVREFSSPSWGFDEKYNVIPCKEYVSDTLYVFNGLSSFMLSNGIAVLSYCLNCKESGELTHKIDLCYNRENNCVKRYIKYTDSMENFKSDLSWSDALLLRSELEKAMAELLDRYSDNMDWYDCSGIGHLSLRLLDNQKYFDTVRVMSAYSKVFCKSLYRVIVW